MLATVAEFGAEGDYTFLDYWADLRDNGVLVVDGWTEAYYGEFSAPGRDTGTHSLVVSYASSPPVEFLFSDPQPEDAVTGAIVGDNMCFRQIEFAGVLDGANNPEGAKMFIDFMTRWLLQASMDSDKIRRGSLIGCVHWQRKLCRRNQIQHIWLWLNLNVWGNWIASSRKILICFIPVRATQMSMNCMEAYPFCGTLLFDPEDIIISSSFSFTTKCGVVDEIEAPVEVVSPQGQVLDLQRAGVLFKLGAFISESERVEGANNKLPVPVTHCMRIIPGDLERAVIAEARGIPERWHDR